MGGWARVSLKTRKKGPLSAAARCRRLASESQKKIITKKGRKKSRGCTEIGMGLGFHTSIAFAAALKWWGEEKAELWGGEGGGVAQYPNGQGARYEVGHQVEEDAPAKVRTVVPSRGRVERVGGVANS